MNQTLYEQIGGEEVFRKLVDRFYDLMDSEPEAAGIRALHPEDLTESRNKTIKVKIPRIVPSGIKRQEIQAITKQKV